MAKTTITGLPLDPDGHQFWVEAVDYFGNSNVIDMPTTGYVPFDTPETLTISNVTNIYTDYSAWSNLSAAEQYIVYDQIQPLNGDLTSPMVIVLLTTTTEFFSHFEIEVDEVNTFDSDPVSIQAQATFDGTTWTSRPVGATGIAGTTYYFRARVFDTLGNYGAWSNIVSEECGDSIAPNEVGSSNVDISTTGQVVKAVVDLGTYTQADDHSYYEWWVNTTSTHPGGNGVKENDVEFLIANKSGQTLYFFVAAVDRSGNRSANYTTNVGNSPFAAADYWTDISSVTDTSGDVIINVTDRGIEDENGVTVIDFTSGSGINATLEGAIDFGTGGKLLLTDNSVTFSGTPVDGTEIIARGMKLYGDADNYAILEKTGTGAINVEIMGGTFRTGSSTSYLEIDSTGIKSYNSSTQRVQILNDGSGWLGGASDFYWDTSGNVTIAGTVTVTNIAATTGTIAAFTIAANSLTSTNIGLHSAGYTEGAEILLGHATLYASAKIGLKADGSGKVASGNFSWDTSGNVTIAGSFSSTATITGGTIKTSGSNAHVEMDSTNGIRAYNSSSVQTVNIDTDGSGWFGLTGTRALEWTTAGAVTIAGWDVTDAQISQTFDTDKVLVIKAYTGEESIYMYDPTPTTGDVRWVGMGTLHNGTSWTTETGIGMTVYNGATYDKYFWLSDQGAEIAGWEFTEELFRSAASAERIELNATENRISVFDATNEKVAMGYLDGLPKNPVYGWVTSSTSTIVTDSLANYTVDELIGGTIEILEGTGNGQTRTVSDNTSTTITISSSWTTTPDTTSKYKVSNYGDWTSSDYGFWAREGDHLAIDGDVRYDNGDWIIQHDASYLVQDSANNTIIRLGTDTGEKGLFTYNASGTNLSKFVTDEIYIGDGSEYLKYTVAGGLEIVGDVTVSSYPSQPFDEDAYIIFPLDAYPMDQSGNDNDPTGGTNVTYVDGGVGGGYCASFPDNTTTSDYFSVSSAYSLGEMTYTFWAKTTETATNFVFHHSTVAVGSFIFNESSTYPRLYLGADNYRRWENRSEQDDGEWHFWVLYIAGSASGDIANSELYVDNNLCSVYYTASSGSPNSLSALRLGIDFDGYMQDFRVYNRQLTSAERIALYTNPMNRSTTRITGDKIRTGTIESNNWTTTTGSQYDLDDGTFYLGGSSSPKLSWNGSALSVTGSITVTASSSGFDYFSDAGDLPAMAATPSGSALFLNSTYIGFYSSGSPSNYIKSDGSGQFAGGDITWTSGGDFRLGDQSNDAYIFWDQSESTLTLGMDVGISFGTTLTPGANMLTGADEWEETATATTDITSGYFNLTYGDDDNNHIVEGITPWGSKGLLWECDPDDGTGSHGGWVGYDFSIDKTKRYRYTNWAKRVGSNDGNFYFGLQTGTNDTSDLTADGSDSNDSNPYFCYPDMQSTSNRCTNGDCELTSSWTAVGTPTTSARSATQAHGGTYSWQITVNAEGEGAYNSAGFDANAAQEYCASFWVYGDGNDWQVYVTDGVQKWYASDDKNIITPATGSWSQYKIYYSTSESYYSEEVSIYFISASGNTTGTLYFDDVYISDQLVSDGDMEVDNDFWADYLTPTTHALSTTQKRSGTYSRRITVNAAGEGCSHTDIKVKRGRQYRATAWLYGNGSLNWKFYFNDGTAHYALNSSGSTDIAVPAAWTKYDIDFVATQDADAAFIRFISGTSNTSGTLYIDDVVVQETPWYLYVGYVNPAGYAGTESIGGLYHYKTGQRVYPGTDYKHMSTATTQELRTFFLGCTTDYETNRVYMHSPNIHLCDGNEPSIGAIIGNSQSMGTEIENTTNISAYLVSSPTIVGGDFAGGNYVTLNADGIQAYGSGTKTFDVDSSDGSVTISSSSSGQRLEINGTNNRMTFYDSSDNEVVRLGENIYSTTQDGLYVSNNGAVVVDNQATPYDGYCIVGISEYDAYNNQTAPTVWGYKWFSNSTDYGGICTAAIQGNITNTSASQNNHIAAVYGQAFHSGAGTTGTGLLTGGWFRGDDAALRLSEPDSPWTAGVNFQVNSSGYLNIIPSGDRLVLWESGETAGDSVSMWADTSGYFNVKPDGDRLVLWESGGAAGDSSSLWTNTSGWLNIMPDGDTLRMWNSNASDYADLYVDTDAYLNVKPLASILRLWQGSGGAGDYTDFYSDTNGYLNIEPYGGLIQTTGYMRVADNTDTRSYFGRTVIGYTGHSDYAALAHYDHSTSTNYALAQNSLGSTYLNTPTGQDIYFRVNNVTVGDFDATGFNVVGQYEMDGSAIIDTSGYQTGVLKTRSYLAFGHDAGDTINDESVTIYPYMAGDTNTTGVANGMGYCMPRAGKITGVSVQFDVNNTSSDAQLDVNVYINNVITSPLVSCTTTSFGTVTDVSAYSTAAEDTFSAGDAIYCRVEFQENAADTCAIDDIAILIEIAT